MNARIEPLPRQNAMVVFADTSAKTDELIQRALTEKVPLENLERLLAMRKELRAEASKAAFDDAMAGFQSECPVIPKKKTAKIVSRKEGGGSFEYKYADIGSIVKIAGPIAAKWGLSYKIITEYEAQPPAQKVTTIVKHVLGHQEESTFRAPIDTTAVVNDMQKAASALTFGKRQSFCNAFGILTSDTDDDGRGAGRQDSKTETTGAQFYAEDKFLAALPTWKRLMEEKGKTANDIIATVASKHRLSPEQIQKIRAAAPVAPNSGDKK